MPTTLAGLLLFVVLLAPGFVHVLRREAERPQRPVSAFRETALVALVSVASNLMALALLIPVRAIAPQHTPDVGALVRAPVGYIRDHYASLAGWSVGLLLLACLCAAALASPAVTGVLGRTARGVPGLRWLVATPTRVVEPVSAWWRLFSGQQHPRARIYLGCELDDGSYLAGWLFSYNPDAPETGDRDLVLTAPLQLRQAGAGETAKLERVDAVVVHANRLVRLHVTYVEPVESDEAGSRPELR